jgi:hypothetical protein
VSALDDAAARAEWARKWFENDRTCPKCGDYSCEMTGTDTTGDSQREDWSCEACEHQWSAIVDLASVSVCTEREADWIDDPYSDRATCKALAESVRALLACADPQRDRAEIKAARKLLAKVTA